MEIEEWLSRVLSEMQAHQRETEGLLAMTERLCTQPCLNGFRVQRSMMEALEELARYCCSSKTAWLNCALAIGTLIGPDGQPDGASLAPWKPWSPPCEMDASTGEELGGQG